MKRAHGMLWRFGVVTFLGMGLVSLMLPWPAQAGGVHVSVGFGLPLPVVVAPAPVYVEPAPVYVEPAPVYVQPAPVVIHRRPVVVHPAPVVVADPYPRQVYYPDYGHHWHKKAKHWKHHRHDD
jgi:hypothetical protein